MSALKLVDTQMSLFDYNALPAPTAIRAREAAERIRLRLRRSTEDIIEIGRDLIAVKDSIGHGNFLPWIDAEFGMTDRTARRFMDVARAYSGKSDIVSNIDTTALYELAAPKTPLEVREEVEKMIAAGEVVTKATVVQLKAELDAAKKGREVATADAEIAEEKAATLQKGLDNINGDIDARVSAEVAKSAERIRRGYDDEIKRLRAELAELRHPRQAPTIDNDTGNVVRFGRALSDDEAAAIDAETDEYVGADFNETASVKDRATVFVAAIRSITSVSASPKAVYAELTEGCSAALIAENLAMVETALSQLQAVKDIHDGE